MNFWTKKRIVALILAVIFVVCATFIYYHIFTIKKEYKMSEDYYEDLEKNFVKSSHDIDFSKLQKINNDIVGWIQIPDTVINYPVVKLDNQYYLSHSFDGSTNKCGTIFLDSSLCVRDNHLILYGHNMKNGSMFGSLKSYWDVDWMKEHSEIKFTLFNNVVRLYEVSDVDIVSVRSFQKIQCVNSGEQEEVSDIRLVTCNGNNEQRLVVYGVLKESMKQEVEYEK